MLTSLSYRSVFNQMTNKATSRASCNLFYNLSIKQNKGLMFLTLTKFILFTMQWVKPLFRTHVHLFSQSQFNPCCPMFASQLPADAQGLGSRPPRWQMVTESPAVSISQTHVHSASADEQCHSTLSLSLCLSNKIKLYKVKYQTLYQWTVLILCPSSNSSLNFWLLLP